MTYKYKLGIPVIFRKDSNTKIPFNFDNEPLYIVYNYIERDKHFNKYDKKIFYSKEIIYEIAEVNFDCGGGSLNGTMLATENQLIPYSGNDEDALLAFKEGKEQWLRLYKSGAL